MSEEVKQAIGTPHESYVHAARDIQRRYRNRNRTEIRERKRRWRQKMKERMRQGEYP